MEVDVSLLSTILSAAFFFIMGAAVIGIIWYLQSVARGNTSKGKNVTQPDPNLAEVARLMRDKETQDLVVGMNDKTFRAASELNPTQLRRLNFASSVLIKWLVATSPSTLPADEPTSTTPEEATQENEWLPAESVQEEAQYDHIPPFMTEPVEEVKPVSTKLQDMVGGILKPTPIPTPEFKSIANQINDILQEMIVDTPFDARGITVNDAPDHGVMVTLDGEKYPGVKDVPDEEVRNLIRSAVVEWEKGASPLRNKS